MPPLVFEPFTITLCFPTCTHKLVKVTIKKRTITAPPATLAPRFDTLAAQPELTMQQIVSRRLFYADYLSNSVHHHDLDSALPHRFLWQAENQLERHHNGSAGSRAHRCS